MPLSDLKRPWHGVPLYGWYLGGSVLAGTSLILYRRWRQNRSLAASKDSVTGSPDLSGPLPGWGGLGDALGPLGGSSPSGPLLGWTSDGRPVYGKGPDVTGLPADDTTVTTPAGPGTTAPPVVLPGGDTQVTLDPIERVAAPLAAIADKILPSLPQISAPNPTPANVPASAAVAGMPAGTPGITQTPSGYTVPTSWLGDIAAIPTLAQAFAAPPADLRSADWNLGKPYTVDSPVPDWQKYGFANQEQYDASKRISSYYDTVNPPTVSEQIMAQAGNQYMTPYGPTDKANWELGHSQGRW